MNTRTFAFAAAVTVVSSAALAQGVAAPPSPSQPPAGSASAPQQAQPPPSTSAPAAPVAPPPPALAPVQPPPPAAPAKAPLWPADQAGAPVPPAIPAAPPPALPGPWHHPHGSCPHGHDARPAEVFPRVEAHIDLHNLFLSRSDSDFDRTRGAYDKNGQAVGAFATVFRPKLTFHIERHLRLYYEAELGLNFWSRNNPDQQAAPAADVFVLKHREVYSEGEFLRGTTGFKVGYQYFRDTTALFLGHWMGAANLWYAWEPSRRLTLFVGQIPDSTWEGLNANDAGVLRNNFKNDIFVFGPRVDLKLGSDATFAAAVHALYDSHTVGQTLWLLAPNLQVDAKLGRHTGSLGAVAQVGKHQNVGLGGQDQNVFAWAVQGHADADFKPLGLALNVLALSPDDQSEGNSRNGAFRYSSKSRSATIILTEDEVRNWYDQLDRRMGRYEGGFWSHRAGLMVADVKGSWAVTDVFRPALVVGAGSVLNKKNALDRSFVGLETDLNLEFRASDHLTANLVGGILVPGGAGGALLNKVKLDAKDPIWMVEGSLMARY